MLKRSTAHNPKLIEASNAIYMTYQDFSKDLKKDLALSKKLKTQEKNFNCQKE